MEEVKTLNKETVATEFQIIQDEICKSLEELDGYAKFEEDHWERTGGGGGRTRIIQNGDLIEKGGVNFSAVHGDLPDVLLKEFGVDKATFFATGVSIVLHPESPLVPIIHMNIRYFDMEGGPKWFGGGIDLTPHYIDNDQARVFHQDLQEVCDRFDESYHPKFKKWADDYFYNPHRDETRGVGGIFFDRLDEKENVTLEDRYEFVKEVGRTFIPAYSKQVTKRNESYTGQQKQWQLLRRGRYVEFNLVYDRGTKFGLQTGGRIESILMSLPKLASWEYDFKTESGSAEQQTLDGLKKGIDWLSV